MSKSQRTKGASGEREVCHLIHDHLGIEAKRNLTQTREGGADIKLSPHYSIEVKRRARIGNIYEWMDQAIAGCNNNEAPIVICRADKKPWLAVLRIDDLFKLIQKNLERVND